MQTYRGWPFPALLFSVFGPLGGFVALLRYLSLLGWEHVNLTGDYLWRQNARIGAGKFRAHRPAKGP